MRRANHLMAVAIMVFTATWPFTVSAQEDHQAHRPGAAPAQTAEKPPVAPDAQTGIMAGMMRAMPMMGMMGSDGPGMGMIEHVEGRIAFLRAELKITDAQTRVWNDFAAALRSNAQGLGAARQWMMGQMGPGQAQERTLIQRLDAQERWLTARLEGTRALKTALTNLYGQLSSEQKTAADELLPPHMGIGMAPMAMMPMARQEPVRGRAQR
jgi:LTXXQ motif family protein